MGKTLDQLTVTSVENQEQAIGLIEKLLTVARPDAVFGEPVTVDGRTLITASEVNVGLGIGFGFGGGATPSGFGEGAVSGEGHRDRGATSEERVVLEGAEAGDQEADSEEPDETGAEVGMGGGGGGGGGASGRPVAVISVGEDGVRVEPVVDVTKIAIAFFTAFGSMVFMLAKMRKMAEGASGG